jgi:hypothetical protein
VANDYTDDTDDTSRQSADDALEPKDDIYNPAVDEETLDQDYDRPAAPASTTPESEVAPADHPEKDYDSDRDTQELYDEGVDNGTDNLTETSPQEPVYPLEPTNDDE